MTSAHDPAEPDALPRETTVFEEVSRPGIADGPASPPAPQSPPTTPKGRGEHPAGRGPATLVPVVYGVGADAYAVAETVVEQLAPSVRPKLVAIDEVAPTLLDVHGLVIVLSSDIAVQRRPPRFRELRQVGEQFRTARPFAAADGFRPGSGNWHRAGALWVLYIDEALGDPDARALVTKACASYVFAPGVPFTDDLLEIYEPGISQARSRKDPAEAATLTNWAWLGSWGIHDVGFAATIKNAIKARCRELDDPSSPKLAKPIPGVAMNRLELVLFAPDLKPDRDSALSTKEQERELTNFIANGARAVRHHIADLMKTFAGSETPFRSPDRYINTKNKQSLYRRLYLTLRTVTEE